MSVKEMEHWRAILLGVGGCMRGTWRWLPLFAIDGGGKVEGERGIYYYAMYYQWAMAVWHALAPIQSNIKPPYANIDTRRRQEDTHVINDMWLFL